MQEVVEVSQIDMFAGFMSIVLFILGILWLVRTTDKIAQEASEQNI